MAPSSPNPEPAIASAPPNPASADTLTDPAPARADIGADAAIVLAALGRLQNAIHDERAVLAKLRARLVEMGEALGRAKATATPAMAGLFAQFEFRVDAMIAIADGETPRRPEASTMAPRAVAATPAEPAAVEPDRVPTVSGVVSRLGPEDDKARPAGAGLPQLADHAGAHSSNVAMLTAMVAALRDSIVAAAPASEAKTPATEANAPPTAYSGSDPAVRPDPPQAAAVQEPDPELKPEPGQVPDPEPAPTAPLPNQAPRTRISATLLPDPEFVIAPVEAAAPPSRPAETARARPAPPLPDPLHALKAMTENERIALFS